MRDCESFAEREQNAGRESKIQGGRANSRAGEQIPR